MVHPNKKKVWLSPGMTPVGDKIFNKKIAFLARSQKVIPEKSIFARKKSKNCLSPYVDLNGENIFNKIFFAFLAGSQKVIPENINFGISHTLVGLLSNSYRRLGAVRKSSHVEEPAFLVHSAPEQNFYPKSASKKKTPANLHEKPREIHWYKF